MIKYDDNMRQHDARLRVFYTEAQGESPDLFLEIKNDLFSVSDTDVYRETEQDVDIFDKIKEMNIIVFPVTDRLLSHPGDHAFHLINAAISLSIPILPLLQTEAYHKAIEMAEQEYKKVCEEGAPDAKEEAYLRRIDTAKNSLETFISEYNGFFHNRQFLEKASRDKTALPFYEKLKTFLNSFLVDEKTEKLIKSAFDAHIFMSYRKRDRKDMQKLMQLIHQQKIFENTALWFDEFLTPGRNFDDTLRDKLCQCDVMMLSVTPNLLEPGNYVYKTEYRFAVDHHKRILAVELSGTDVSEYKRMFPEVPDVVPIEKTDEIINRLTEILSSVAWSDRLDNPEHTFYMGLAYLYGLDTNTDREKGHKLIIASAEQGYIDAMEKRASMCMYGEGEAASYSDAVKWQARTIQLRKELFTSESTYAHALAIGLSERTMGDYVPLLKQEPYENYCQSKIWLEKALSLSDDADSVTDALESLESLIIRFPVRVSDGDFEYQYYVRFKKRLEILKLLAQYHYKQYTPGTVIVAYKEAYDLSEKAWKTSLDMYLKDTIKEELSYLEECLKKETDPALISRLKELYFKEYGDSESIRKGLKLLERYPESPSYTLEKKHMLLYALKGEGKYDEALKQLDELTGIDNMTLHYADCYLGLKEYKKAKDLYENSLQKEIIRFNNVNSRREWVYEAKTIVLIMEILITIYSELGEMSKLKDINDKIEDYRYASNWRPKNSYEWGD